MPTDIVHRFVLVVSLSVGAGGKLHSQVATASVAGHWSATFDSDISGKDGNYVVKSRAVATLDLTARGDSVFGTWKAGNLETLAVSGTFDGRVLRMTTTTAEREIRINGTPAKVLARTSWTAALDGGALNGVMLIRLGDREPPPRKWEAQRGK